MDKAHETASPDKMIVSAGPKAGVASPTAISSAACKVNEHCVGDHWTVGDVDLLARLIAIIAMGQWIEELTGRTCVFADPLWKPSRQARGVLLYDSAAIVQMTRNAIAVQRAEDTRKKKYAKNLRKPAAEALQCPPHALFGLQHNWLAGAAPSCTLTAISDVPVTLTGKLNLDGSIYLTPNINKVAAQVAAAAARNGLKGIVFVNRKDTAASTAREISVLLGDPPEQTQDEEEKWKALEIELGGLEHSILPGPAAAVPHNALMLRLERDLAERLFRRADGAKVIVGTPTLAQGLNLPAHIAILAGDKRSDPDEGGREDLEAHEILNAAARAGRAGHLANGIVLLIPEAVLQFRQGRPFNKGVLDKLKSVLPEDDRCLSLSDPLQTILDRINVAAAADPDVECALNRLTTAFAPEGAETEATTRFGLARLLSSVSETPGLSFAHLGGLGNGGWRGALRVAQRQAPLRGEGSGKLGWGLPAEA